MKLIVNFTIVSGCSLSKINHLSSFNSIIQSRLYTNTWNIFFKTKFCTHWNSVHNWPSKMMLFRHFQRYNNTHRQKYQNNIAKQAQKQKSKKIMITCQVTKQFHPKQKRNKQTTKPIKIFKHYFDVLIINVLFLIFYLFFQYIIQQSNKEQKKKNQKTKHFFSHPNDNVINQIDW